jgi:hypothetical protein
MAKVMVSLQLPPEVIAMLSAFAQHRGVAKQVAAAELIVAGFKKALAKDPGIGLPQKEEE